jgi:hypothetical protein
MDKKYKFKAAPSIWFEQLSGILDEINFPELYWRNRGYKQFITGEIAKWTKLEQKIKIGARRMLKSKQTR